MEEFDVIIAGAGPAGLNCAKYLANTHLKVLILEKNSKIGPKICAGGLTEKDIKYLQLPKQLIESEFKEIEVHLYKSILKLRNKENFAYTINRTKLGEWQLDKINKNKNITIRKNSKVSRITKKYLIVNNNLNETNKKIKYKYLVGSDGSASIVRRYLNLQNKNMGIGMQYIIPTTKYKKFKIFFNPKLFDVGYAWIFPHKKYVSIGCGLDNKIIRPKKLHENFNKWLDENNIDISKGKYESFILNCNYQGHKFKNIFLTGDAAGLVSKFTGEGIYQALISGEEVAKSILDNKYESEKIKQIVKHNKSHEKIIKIFSKHHNRLKIAFHIVKILSKIPIIKKKIISKVA